MKVPVADLVCYALLTITVTATCTEAESTNTLALTQDKEKRISKRETTLLIDNYPVESKVKQPKVIYRRVSRYPPYRRTKPKYGKSGPKYKSVKHKGYQGKRVTYRHAPATKTKKGRYPPRYSAPKRVPVKHSSAVKKKPRGSYKKPAIYHQDPAPYRLEPAQYPPEPIGFGEPPSDFGQSGLDTPVNDHDVPVDSYGAPIKTLPSASDNRYAYNVIAAHDELKAPISDPSYHSHDVGGDYKTWNHNEENYEPAYAFSKKHPTYTAHHNHHEPAAENPYDDDGGDTYTYFGQKMKESNRYKPGAIKSPSHYSKPRRPGKLSSLKLKNPEPTVYDEGEEYEGVEEEDHHVAAIRNHHSDHVVVGGQYAEPPARYVPRFQPSAAMASDDEDFRPPRHADADMMSSATVSSYINYKNSNLAFSPQNLNDAFST